MAKTQVVNAIFNLGPWGCEILQNEIIPDGVSQINAAALGRWLLIGRTRCYSTEGA